MRKKILKNKNRAKALKNIFHLNIFEGEYDISQAPAVFDERHDSDPVRRELQNTVITLQRNLQETRTDLQETRQELTTKEQTVSGLNARVEDLSATNVFLSNHVNALEKENKEQHQKILDAKNSTPSSSNDAAATKNGRKVLGTMKFNELGPDAKNRTRAAYREKAQELNEFGANRGLTVKEIILRDENGCKVPVNVEKPHTYPNLTPQEKSEVETACAWKDVNRISDRVYSTLTKIGSIPPASHVKEYEKEVNSQLGPILPVNLSFPLYVFLSCFLSFCFPFYCSFRPFCLFYTLIFFISAPFF